MAGPISFGDADRLYPDALVHADIYLADLQVGDVRLTLTRKNKLQWRTFIDGQRAGANWHANVGVWVRYSCGFSHRITRRRPSWERRTPELSRASVQPIGVALGASDAEGNVQVMIDCISPLMIDYILPYQGYGTTFTLPEEPPHRIQSGDIVFTTRDGRVTLRPGLVPR